jgi:S-DNA-T family DNA segregation ATPase FtsK/SpoIIIE
MRGLYQEMKIRPGVHYRPAGRNSSRVWVFELENINPRALRKMPGLDELSMWAGLDERNKIRLGWEGRSILLEIPKPEVYWRAVTIEYLERSRAIRRGAVATIGLGLEDDPVRIDFTHELSPHIWETGSTGSGKTNAQRLIAWNICHNTTPDEARMIILDVAKRGYNWKDFNGVAHMAHPVIVDLEEADKALAWASQEIDRRGKQGRKTPRIFLVVDELKALVDDSQVAIGYLARIAAMGREFGIHLNLATQYAQIQMLGGKQGAELKRNIPTRLCGRVDDANAAQNALGVKNSGAEFLQGRGDFLLRSIGTLSRLTVAKIEPYHIEKLPRAGIMSRLDMPDDDVVNSGAPAGNTSRCVEPEHVALALTVPEIGISKLRQEIIDRGLEETFSKDRAKKVKEFADRTRAWIQENTPANEGQYFGWLNGDWREI